MQYILNVPKIQNILFCFQFFHNLFVAFSSFTKSRCTPQVVTIRILWQLRSASLKISDLSVAPPQHWLRVSVALRHGEAAFSRVCNSAPAAFPACRPSVPVSLEVIYLTLRGSLRSHKKGLSATFFSLSHMQLCFARPVNSRWGVTLVELLFRGLLGSEELKQLTDGAFGPTEPRVQNHHSKEETVSGCKWLLE